MKKLLLACFLVTTMSAFGASIAVQSGGIAINSTNLGAAGTTGDPWLINETMTAPGVLIIRDFGAGNPTGSGHSRGRWFEKTVFNETGVDWTSFELELQVILGSASGGGDGLSFADGSLLTGSFSSDQFAGYTRQDVTRDYLNFSGGLVAPGESVTFRFVVTDNGANNPFYLAQTPNLSDVPEPTTMVMLGSGLVLAGILRKRLARR
jgi:hypothetical protein